MTNLEEIWSFFTAELQKEVAQTAFDLWFSNVKLTEMSDKSVVLTVENEFKKGFLENAFKSKIEDAFEKVLGFKIAVHINSAVNQTPAPEIVEIKKESDENEELIEKTEISTEPFASNSSYTFNNFIVGNSNKLAHAACIAVANNVGYDYNPLFIYGPSGLGKTHLLHAIANHIRKSNPDINIIYVSGENFTNQLVYSISTRTTEQFRNRYRKADLLMIDDIQFLANKTGIQEEFFHTFNALYENSRQMIFTSDRPANEIKPLEERILTRFNWGMTADINPPDFELRAAILTSKAKAKNLVLTPETINMLAEKLTNNIRQLEGAVKKLCAISMISDAPITLEIAKNAISDLTYEVKTSQDLTPEKILEVVTKKYGVTIEELKSKKKPSQIVNARQIAMYLLRKKLNMSLPKIGALLHRDHATVKSSIDKVENEIKCNSLFEIEINELIKELN